MRRTSRRTLARLPYPRTSEDPIHPHQKALILLNVIGGIAVLGSYVWGLSSSEIRGALWGGVPEAARPLYTVNMFLAAAGYFPFSILLILRTTPMQFSETTGLGYGVLITCYAFILICSVLWLPLTAQMIQTPGSLLWALIRLDLLLVGLGSLGILFLCLRFALSDGGILPWLAMIGAIPFFIQTGILDALVWPAFYPR